MMALHVHIISTDLKTDRCIVYFIAWLGALAVTSLVTEEMREEQGCQLLTGGRVGDDAKIFRPFCEKAFEVFVK